MQSKTFTFSDGHMPPGLVATSHTVGGSGPSNIERTFSPHNVSISGGFLHLKTPGGQAGRPSIACAEIATDFNTLYGSMRTWAVLSNTSGVCNGMFMYHSDEQETDIEWLAQPQQKSATGKNGFADKSVLHFVNQTVAVGNPPSHLKIPCPPDTTTAVHEYRLDWAPNATTFFLDGVLQATMRTNVPTKPGRWMWNCWTNGNPGWSGGPPATDAVMKIQKIVIQYDSDGVVPPPVPPRP